MIEKNIEILDTVYFLVSRYGYEQVKLSPHDKDFYLFNSKAKQFSLIRLTTNSIYDYKDNKDSILKKAEQVGNLFNTKVNLLTIHFTEEEGDLFFEPGYYQAIMNRNFISPILLKEFPSIKSALLPLSNDLQSDLDNRHERFKDLNKKRFEKMIVKQKEKKPFKLKLVHIIIALNVIMYIAGYFISLMTNRSFSMVFMGALYKPLVYGANEWWRIITSGFIHADFLHILVNMIALLQLGTLVEEVYGKKQMAFIYTAGLLSSSLMALTNQSPEYLTIGASGAIFALLGAVIVYLFSSGLFKIKGIRTQIVRTLMINFLISLIPGVSFYGHLGGLLGGSIAALAVNKAASVKSAVTPAIISLAMIISGLFSYAIFIDDNLYPLNRDLDRLIVVGYYKLGMERRAERLVDMYTIYYQEIGEDFQWKDKLY